MGTIRLGICTAYTNAEKMAKMGYDYIELGFNATASLSDEEYAKVKAAIDAAPIKAEAFNGMLPGDFRLTGEEADLVPVKAFCERAFARAAALGGKVVVFGSGAARMVPEGFDREKANEQLVTFLHMAAEIAEKYDMRIVIEPLNKRESNILNSVREGAELALRAQEKNVGALADLYHIGQENETMDGILFAGKNLWHCHIAEVVNRTNPCEGDGSQDWYDRFFAALKQIDYTGRVSIEGKIPDFDKDAAISLAYLRKYL